MSPLRTHRSNSSYGSSSFSGATLLILFTRFPQPGAVKTRLIPALGPEGAAELHRDMTAHVLATALPPHPRWHTQIHYTGADETQMRAWLGNKHGYVPQAEGDLGARMLAAFTGAFDKGADRVLIIGSDCPRISSQHLREAEHALQHHDLVLGPAEDGGYYLIGLYRRAQTRSLHHLFEGVTWGTESVLHATLLNAEKLQLRHALLPTLPDVDRPEDLPVWEEAKRRARISIIIPALNEAQHIAATIAACASAHNCELIVVDGGSTDGTPARAEAAGACVITAPRGRARQMNAGAAAATGELLLFLHADTLLPHDFADHIRRALLDTGPTLGAFRFAVDAKGLGYRIIEFGARLRSRFLRFPYGDQALFLSRHTFDALGGFPDQPLLEDYDLVRAARRSCRIVILDPPAVSSARRWQRRGLLRTTLLNYLIFFVYPLGVSPERIARWYHRGPRM